MTTVEHRPTDQRSYAFARSVNMVLGAWLFVSAFTWPHSEASRINAIVCGVLVIFFALGALRIPAMRWLNAAISIWVLIAAALLSHRSVGTLWNNVIIGLLILLVAGGGLLRPMPQSPMP